MIKFHEGRRAVMPERYLEISKSVDSARPNGWATSCRESEDETVLDNDEAKNLQEAKVRAEQWATSQKIQDIFILDTP